MSEAFDTDNQYEAVCPYCGFPDADWWDCHGAREAKRDGDTWLANCPSCGKDYSALLHLEYTISTEKKEDNHAN